MAMLIIGIVIGFVLGLIVYKIKNLYRFLKLNYEWYKNYGEYPGTT